MHQIAELLSNGTPTPEANTVSSVSQKEDEKNCTFASTSSPSLCFNGCSPRGQLIIRHENLIDECLIFI